MPPPSFQLKLDRAREHLNTLDKKVGAWIDGKPYTAVDEPNPDPPPQAVPDGHVHRRVRVTHVTDIPPDFAILIGDCVFNLRAALDHLNLSLAKAFAAKHGKTLTDKQIRDSEFPIFSRPMDPKREESPRLGSMDPAAGLAIKGMQPYHRGGSYATHPLWQLHELNRIDKHQTLAVCAVESRQDGRQQLSARFGEGANVASGHFLGAPSLQLKLDAILLWWSGLPVDASKDIQMNPDITPEVVFGQEGPAALEPVIPALEASFDFVSNTVVSQLSKFL
jgi:hypothetical protein